MSISQDIFGGCTTLEKLQIPENVSMIEEGAFDDCEALDSITILAVTPPEVATGKELLPEEKYATTILTVPERSISAYQNHDVWGKFKNIVGSDATVIHLPQMGNHKTVNPQSFDLSGRRLAAPPAKGMYIENGRKIIK